MTPIQAVILGIVQGLTEFLPISSSGHLVLVPYWLNWSIPEQEAFIFDILVQVATLLAVIVYFWQDILRIVIRFFTGILHKEPFADPDARLGWYIIIATIPAGLIGLFIKDMLATLFSTPLAVALFLLVTALLMFVGDRIGRRSRDLAEMTFLDALIIGAFQALSILPGVSRSGSTISGGMFRNLDRQSAARFSFLMSIPIMLAAGLLATIDLLGMPNVGNLILAFLPGFIVSGVVGYLSIRWLLAFLKNNRFTYFIIYCILISILTVMIHFVRG